MTTAHLEHPGHEHAHAPECGHRSFPHVDATGDHTDYAHDGHLHREHDSHWDECEPAGHSAHVDHAHAHGPDCGHEAVPHGDHTDYLHDGHRHAVHDDHVDEH